MFTNGLFYLSPQGYPGVDKQGEKGAPGQKGIKGEKGKPGGLSEVGTLNSTVIPVRKLLNICSFMLIPQHLTFRLRNGATPSVASISAGN